MTPMVSQGEAYTSASRKGLLNKPEARSRPQRSAASVPHIPANKRVGNWLQPMWGCAYTHPWFDAESAFRIGIWEDAGRMVGVAQYELRLGEAFFQIHPSYEHLKRGR